LHDLPFPQSEAQTDPEPETAPSDAPPSAEAAVADAGRETPTEAFAAVLPGWFAFAGALERDEQTASLAAAGAVVVEIEGVAPSMRGRLADVVDDAIERELASRGAPGAGLASALDRDAALSDQLFRARRLGARGIAIVLGPLRAAAAARGALAPEDCETLRLLAAATAERPLVLLVDARDAATKGYGEPIELGRILGDGESAHAHASGSAGAGAGAGAGAHALAGAGALAGVDPDADVDSSPLAGEGVGLLESAKGRVAERADLPETDGAALAEAPRTERATLPAAGEDDAVDPLARHTAGASVVEREEAWRSWTLALTAARGPQALGALERLFEESYMPLANAIGAGLDDPRARAAHEEFRAGFAKSYTEAFPAFAVTTKRPRMVLDAHAIAAHTARLHGARSTRMLLVDAMRWDLSRLVAERLVARLGPRAVLTDEMILWSALPTTTMRQLETIARGIDALRTPAESDIDSEPPRARTADYVRRMRVGPRELHKLDLVEARLESARGGVQRALPEMAERAAETIARHALALPPHTLLFVFGDHGFSIDRSGVARQGGASPEEVLVGAFALLVGDVH
jgi:hypothetical protein